MNAALVAVDASVAVKWVVTGEPFANHAETLLRASLQANQRLVGPPHLHGEVANALYQRLRSQDPARHLTDHETEEALATYLALPVELVSPPGLYAEALRAGRTFALPSLYDALYVALARLLGCKLWTADRRLLTALGDRAPWVRFIGDYSL